MKLSLPEKISLGFLDKIRTILIQNTSDDWLEKFGQLIAFKEENGHLSPPTSQSSLGNWCANQRQAYSKGNLS